MKNFPVVEKFVSINGEGRKAGELSVFIRFRGCNLACSYCDTRWANTEEAQAQQMTVKEICDFVLETGVKNVTLTGGEPMLQPGIETLAAALAENAEARVEIETNGSIDLAPFWYLPCSFTVDYKLPGSGMEPAMCRSNFAQIRAEDTVKFVAGSRKDLACAKKVIDSYGLIGRTAVYISPVFGQIEPAEIVEFMIEEQMNGVRLQIQMHKVIWDPDKKGV